jgi:twitching motility protein PilT
MMDISELLIAAERNNASDLHLSTGNAPILRVHGDIVALEAPPLDAAAVKQLLHSIMSEEQRSEYERELEIDFSISLSEKMRFRVNAFHTMHGPAAVCRSIPTSILSLEQIQAPSVLARLCQLHKGLILVTGPTGSGKSTTLAAMVDHINANYKRHILTIEDPIEFVHTAKKSLINQREVGHSTRSFARALKSALREDPDVILVGEMRDLETIQLAITAAETGHLVMGTLHTSSAAKTIDRVIDVFPAQDKEMIRAMLSISLEAIISQRLLKRSDAQSRTAAYEILLGTPAVRNLIREGKIPQITSMIQMGKKIGMRTMHDSLHHLFNDGIISSETLSESLKTGATDMEEAKTETKATRKDRMFGTENSF